MVESTVESSSEVVVDLTAKVPTETVPVNEEVVERKTIVYETLVDPTVVKVAGEKLRTKLFVRFGFLRPKSEEIQFVSIEKYYEPYIVISGKYTIDYYRACIYTVDVDKKVREVILLNQKFKPKETEYVSRKGCNIIRLEGEERLLNEDKASLILNKSGQESTLEKVPVAPSEKNPKKILKKLGEKAKKLEISPDTDVDIIRSRIVKRPKDIKRIVHELFEVNERAVIYTPIYEVLFRNLKTGEEKTIEFDGVTSKRIQREKRRKLINLSF
ncbi:MAG: hypothetical protein NWE85_01440 [Candidatus Bathyarchaeota archaeon]|nr:hypothetical protein [Candidatus Bathyarchaeota archaeon]